MMDDKTTNDINVENPDVCSVCKHLKLEHGGRLTGLAKNVPGGNKFLEQLRTARLQGTIPPASNAFACLVMECMCKGFRN